MTFNIKILQLLLLGIFLLVSACSSSGDLSTNTKDGSQAQLNDNSPSKGLVVNRVRMIVGSEPITDLDIKQMKKRIKYKRNQRGSLEKRAVDALIERSIVAIESEKQSIIVSDLRLENEVKKRMRRTGISKIENFKKMIRSESGMPYDVWLEEMRYDLIKSQLVRIALTVPQANDAEIEKFYRKNRNKVGVEVRYREMIFRGSTESETSRIAGKVYRQVRSNPSSFATVARTHAANVAPTKNYGGLHAYTELSGIAQNNRALAGVLFNTAKGSVSRVFRDSRGRYMIVKLESKRPVPISKVRDLIRQRLYVEKQATVFDDWLDKRRQEVAIVVVK